MSFTGVFPPAGSVAREIGSRAIRRVRDIGAFATGLGEQCLGGMTIFSGYDVSDKSLWSWVGIKIFPLPLKMHFLWPQWI